MAISNELLQDIYSVEYKMSYAKYSIVLRLKSRNILGFRKKVEIKYSPEYAKRDTGVSYTVAPDEFYNDQKTIEQFMKLENEKLCGSK